MSIEIHPDEARRFAAVLRNAAEELTASNRAAAQAITDAGGFWKDAKYAQFERHYDDTSVLLKTFCEAAERYAQYLDEKARRLMPYVDGR